VILQKINMNEQQIRICYTNYRGETSIRTVVPQKIIFGSNEWHKEPQWLMEAIDVEKGQPRTFALKDIRAWFTN
jgi:predicted DNA-binding transcriptional regulator YafY